MAYETYYDRYEELKQKYKIARASQEYSSKEKRYIPINQEDYDIIIEFEKSGYAHKKYRVIKNAPKLSNQDLAIICDCGNLCFGYRMEGQLICIHTD